MARKRCEADYCFDPKGFADGKSLSTMRRDHRRCQRNATTYRRAMRFGDKTKNEPTLVHFNFQLCRWCAEAWDESKAEGEAEARCS
jgi:hypothetical protein